MTNIDQDAAQEFQKAEREAAQFAAAEAITPLRVNLLVAELDDDLASCVGRMSFDELASVQSLRLLWDIKRAVESIDREGVATWTRRE